MSNTLNDMLNRINDEVLGSINNYQVLNAIGDAIRYFERQRFWFNEYRWDMTPLLDSKGQIINDSAGQPILSSDLFTTVPGVEFYDAGIWPALATIAHLDKLLLLVGPNRYSLYNQTPQLMDDQAVSSASRGLPTDWTFNAGEIRLYPIPAQAYPVIGWGTMKFQPLTDLKSTNPWLNDAERLIRCEAKRLLFTDIIRDGGQAQAMAGEVQRALSALQRETVERGGPPRLRATAF